MEIHDDLPTEYREDADGKPLKDKDGKDVVDEQKTTERRRERSAGGTWEPLDYLASLWRNREDLVLFHEVAMLIQPDNRVVGIDLGKKSEQPESFKVDFDLTPLRISPGKFCPDRNGSLCYWCEVSAPGYFLERLMEKSFNQRKAEIAAIVIKEVLRRLNGHRKIKYAELKRYSELSSLNKFGSKSESQTENQVRTAKQEREFEELTVSFEALKIEGEMVLACISDESLSKLAGFVGTDAAIPVRDGPRFSCCIPISKDDSQMIVEMGTADKSVNEWTVIFSTFPNIKSVCEESISVSESGLLAELTVMTPAPIIDLIEKISTEDPENIDAEKQARFQEIPGLMKKRGVSIAPTREYETAIKTLVNEAKARNALNYHRKSAR